MTITSDQAVHAVFVAIGLLIALVGYLAREQLSDVKTGQKEMKDGLQALTIAVTDKVGRLDVRVATNEREIADLRKDVHSISPDLPSVAHLNPRKKG